MKSFNTAGTCFPDKHYMVDIQSRLDIIKGMVEKEEYFCINRGRQYGKTTTLEAVNCYLSTEYSVFQLSFEGLADSTYSSLERFCYTFISMLYNAIDFEEVNGISLGIKDLLKGALDSAQGNAIDEQTFTRIVPMMNMKNERPIILIIDEVDQAGNWETFIQFLGILRKMYLNRERRKTFKSVILAGVYDIKNLKLKVRSNNEHQYNSPWNIAAPFDVDMSLSQEGIAKMLEEFKQDTKANVNANEIATLLRDYTGGYPYLVSRLCQLMESQSDWTRTGFLKAEKTLLFEKNTLFDDLNKKLEQFPDMRKMLEDILYNGRAYTFNLNSKEIEIANMFGIVYNNAGQVAISNRIFETVLYEKFVSEDIMNGNKVYEEAQLSKPEFVKDGQLNMPLILSRFVKTFQEIYGERPNEFLEEEGRRLFLLYVKPIINGVGNYYIEAQTRDGQRTDLIIDYVGHRYIIEMKIWRGNSYNERGEKQLAEYLDRYDETEGYLVSFCFNKNKVTGLKEPIRVEGKKIMEVIV